MVEEIREGYKKTKLGWIPEEWAVKQIGTITNIKIGRDLKEEKFSNKKTDKHKYPVYSNTVSQEGLYGYYDFKEYAGNSVTVVGRGVGLGTAFARKNSFGAIGRLVVLFPKNETNSIFLTYYINHKVHFFTESSGIPQLTGVQIAKYQLALPSLPEQKKIARILSTWDKTIQTLEQLLAKKRLLKKSLMQNLLTGEVRFPEFVKEEGFRETKLGQLPKDWKIVKLNSLGTYLKGKGITKAEVIQQGIPCIRYGEIYTKHHNYIKQFYSFINSESANNSIRIYKGDLLFAGSGETPEEIGKCVAYLNEKEAYAGGDIIILRTKNVDANYLGFLLNHDLVNRQKYKLAQGNSVVHIYSSGIKNIKIILPNSVKEQQSIAKTLNTIDKEIQQLEKEKAALQQQKKGLMQILLTGEKRVKTDS